MNKTNKIFTLVSLLALSVLILGEFQYIMNLKNQIIKKNNLKK